MAFFQGLLVCLALSWMGRTPGLVSAQIIDYLSLPHTIININSDDIECIDVPCNMRYLSSITSGDTLDSLTVGNQICISPNGGIEFGNTALVSGSFSAAPTGANLILPFYFDWTSAGAVVIDNDHGMYFKVFYLEPELANAKTLLSDCGMDNSYLSNFEPTFVAYITWSDLLSPGVSPVMATASNLNTFQVVLIGNPADLFVIINYESTMEVTRSTTDSSGNSPTIALRSAGGEDFDPTGGQNIAGGSNCVPPVAGRWVFYIGDDSPVEPQVVFNCDPNALMFPCGQYYPVREGSGGASSATMCPTTGACTCATGYSSLYCVIDSVNNCGNGQCLDDDAQTQFCEDTGYEAGSTVSDQLKCVCQRGYDPDISAGAGCELEIDFCVELAPADGTALCQNGGTCTPEFDDFSCACATGYDGSTCEVELCAADPCVNFVSCTDLAVADGNIGFSCECTAGYKGTRCDEDDCTDWVDVGSCTRTDGFTANCGGCGIGLQTRTCTLAGPATSRVGPCNVWQCDWSVLSQRTEIGRSRRGRRIRRFRRACHDFSDPLNPVVNDPFRPRLCVFKRNGVVRFTGLNCRL